MPWARLLDIPLGEAGDLRAESDAILAEHSVDSTPFSSNLTEGLSPNLVITPEDLQMRRDLRHIAICSIDPKTARDLDDALHCFQLPNGNWEVGVY